MPPAFKPETYEEVSKWMEETPVQYAPNTKKGQSKERYEGYMKAKTVGEALDFGAKTEDFLHDFEHNLLKRQGGPVRDVVIDPRTIVDENKLTRMDLAVSRWVRRRLPDEPRKRVPPEADAEKPKENPKVRKLVPTENDAEKPKENPKVNEPALTTSAEAKSRGFKPETYEEVSKWMEETPVQYAPNTKKGQSKERYEGYMKAKTVGEALDLGAKTEDLLHDFEHNLLKRLGGPVRDVVIDPRTILDENKLTRMDLAVSRWVRRRHSDEPRKPVPPEADAEKPKENPKVRKLVPTENDAEKPKENDPALTTSAEAKSKKFKPETYEEVAKWLEETPVQYGPNTKKGKSNERYEGYMKARTVGEALDLGSKTDDLLHDFEHNFLKRLGGPVREAVIDPKTLVDENKLTRMDLAVSKWVQRRISDELRTLVPREGEAGQPNENPKEKEPARMTSAQAKAKKAKAEEGKAAQPAEAVAASVATPARKRSLVSASVEGGDNGPTPAKAAAKVKVQENGEPPSKRIAQDKAAGGQKATAAGGKSAGDEAQYVLEEMRKSPGLALLVVSMIRQGFLRSHESEG